MSYLVWIGYLSIMDQVDVILGMDWLSKYLAVIDCAR